MHKAATHILDHVVREAASRERGAVLVSKLLGEPSPRALAPWDDCDDCSAHALLVMALVGIGSLSLRRISTSSGWASAFVVVEVNGLDHDAFTSGCRRLAIALPPRVRARLTRPPRSRHAVAVAEQALLASFYSLEAEEAQLPLLFRALRDAGGSDLLLPPPLLSRLAAATEGWLLPELLGPTEGGEAAEMALECAVVERERAVAERERVVAERECIVAERESAMAECRGEPAVPAPPSPPRRRAWLWRRMVASPTGSPSPEPRGSAPPRIAEMMRRFGPSRSRTRGSRSGEREGAGADVWLERAPPPTRDLTGARALDMEWA